MPSPWVGEQFVKARRQRDTRTKTRQAHINLLENQGGLLRHSVKYEHSFTYRKSHSSTNGQLNGGSLHQQTRRNQIKPSSSNSLGHMEPVSITDNNPVCTPFRNLEYQTGCKIETSERQTRMDVGQTTACQHPETLLHIQSICIPYVYVFRMYMYPVILILVQKR